MDLSALPTDNLYKFMALSGVAIALVSVYVPIWGLLKLKTKVADLNIELAAIEVRTEEVAFLTALAAHSGKLEDVKDPQLLKRIWDAKAELAVHRAKIDAIKTLVRSMIALAVVAVVGGFTGVRIAEKGFTDWHDKLQIHLDRAVQAQCPPTP